MNGNKTRASTWILLPTLLPFDFLSGLLTQKRRVDHGRHAKTKLCVSPIPAIQRTLTRNRINRWLPAAWGRHLLLRPSRNPPLDSIPASTLPSPFTASLRFLKRPQWPFFGTAVTRYGGQAEEGGARGSGSFCLTEQMGASASPA